MTYYVLLYDKLVPDYVQRRAALREEHLRLVRAAHARGELQLAGAFEPVDGAELLFTTEDPGVPENFAKADPYVREGLVLSWKVRRWNVVVLEQ